MAPLLSVIIPIHNSEKYLSKCIDSVIAQTFNDFEIILVNDASTDLSEKICDRYAADYAFVKAVHKEHGGPMHTRKAGLNEASGTYVSFIDSDDYIEPQMYEYLIDKIVKYSADIAVCNIAIESGNTRTPLYKSFEEGLYDKKSLENKVYNLMLFNERENEPGLHPSLCNKIIKRSILEDVMKNTTNDIRFGEDGICSYPCLLDAQRVYITSDKFFYIYRQVEDSVSHKYDSTLLDKIPLLISVFDDEFKKRNFDGKLQIDLYAALQLVYSIRNELLYNKDKNWRKKSAELKKYLSQPRFIDVFEAVKNENVSKVLKMKCFLLQKKQIHILHALFCIREKTMLLKERKNEPSYQ